MMQLDIYQITDMVDRSSINQKEGERMNNAALFKISYGLYLLTAKDTDKDNGCIINTVLQITSNPPLVGIISVNKQNHTHDMIMSSKKFNISTLSTTTPFEVFKHFGFQSGKTLDKLAGYDGVKRSENGLVYLAEHANAYLSFEVIEALDFGTHTVFKADIVAGEVLSNAETVTYNYYQQQIKPKPQQAPAAKTGWRCKICGYVYEGDPLPADFICPLCKHGAVDFVKI